MNEKIHWQGINVGSISRGNKYAAGFRANDEGFWRNDIALHFSPDKALRWIRSQNWTEEEIRTRGRIDSRLAEAKIAIVGVGAIGSTISELIVRSGGKNLVLIDADKLQIGNLSRHVLTMADLGLSKSESLAEHLKRLAPHITVQPIDDEFIPEDQVDQDVLRTCDIILDCTGSDKAISELKTFDWAGPKVFLSISIGANANRLFLYLQRAERFDEEDMRVTLRPWLAKERAEMTEDSFPREHIGCWHPIFPARYDDIWIAASTALRALEQIFTNPDMQDGLKVLEKSDFPLSTGYKVATLEPND